MKKGIIMEMDETFLTLLTPEGEFLLAERNNLSYQLGEEIHFFPINSRLPKRKKIKKFSRIRPIWAASAVAALVLALSSLLPGYQDHKAYAYMSIDVNPSIELGVNQAMQVVELKGYNQDGKKIVSALHDWKNQDVSVLTETILSEMKKEGYLELHKSVVISTVHREATVKQVEEKLKQNINEITRTAKEQKLAVTIFSGTKDDLEKAHKLGMTTGQYQKQKQETFQSKKGPKQVKPKPANEKNKNKSNKPETHQVPTAPHGQKETKNNSKPKETKIPPGQQKKQIQKTPVKIKTQPGDTSAGNSQKVPPGQQKKTIENKNKVKNNGQSKKQDTQKDHSNRNKDDRPKEKHQK